MSDLANYQNSNQRKYALMPKSMYDLSDTAQSISAKPGQFRDGSLVLLSIDPRRIPELYAKVIEQFDPVFEFSEDLDTICLMLDDALQDVKSGEPEHVD
jgi:hypothetical protein